MAGRAAAAARRLRGAEHQELSLAFDGAAEGAHHGRGPVWREERGRARHVLRAETSLRSLSVRHS